MGAGDILISAGYSKPLTSAELSNKEITETISLRLRVGYGHNLLLGEVYLTYTILIRNFDFTTAVDYVTINLLRLIKQNQL